MSRKQDSFENASNQSDSAQLRKHTYQTKEDHQASNKSQTEITQHSSLSRRYSLICFSRENRSALIMWFSTVGALLLSLFLWFCLIRAQDIGPDTCGQDREVLSTWCIYFYFKCTFHYVIKDNRNHY